MQLPNFYSWMQYPGTFHHYSLHLLSEGRLSGYKLWGPFQNHWHTRGICMLSLPMDFNIYHWIIHRITVVVISILLNLQYKRNGITIIVTRTCLYCICLQQGHTTNYYYKFIDKLFYFCLHFKLLFHCSVVATDAFLAGP